MEKDRTFEETLQAARIVETSKQHMQIIGADCGKIESVGAVSTQSSYGAKSSSGKGGKNGRFDSGKEDGKYCGNYGRKHLPGDCAATGHRCHNCHLLGHFARFCPKKAGCRKQVNTLIESDDVPVVKDSDGDFESLSIGAVGTNQGKDWTETVDFGNVKIAFKVDTGAQCNVLPKTIYDQITSEPLKPSNARLETYAETHIRPVGKCDLICKVWGNKYNVPFQVVDENFAALLGRASCEEINLIKRVDQVRSDSILKEFPNVLRGMGCLPGDYHITLDSSVTPVVHAPRRVPHAKRDKLKQELDRMENQGIIEKTPINEPTDWVNSLVCVTSQMGHFGYALTQSA